MSDRRLINSRLADRSYLVFVAVRDILLDIGRTWTRLALEAEQWTRMNRPSSRFTKAAQQNAPLREPKPPTPLQPRGSRRDPRVDRPVPILGTGSHI